MDYQDALDAFFAVPEDNSVPEPVSDAGPARRLRDAGEPIATHAIWCREVNEALAERGLDFLSQYVGGRAAPFGPVPGTVVSSAFAVFEPNLATSTWEAALDAMTPADLLAVQTPATVSSLSQILGDDDAIGEVAEILEEALSYADPTGRPLYSALASLDWPAEPAGRLWRACDLLREHRGDSHIAASVASGLDPVEMNILTELYVGMPLGSYTASRGWPQEDIDDAAERLQDRGLVEGDALSSDGLQFRADLELTTDLLEAPIVAAIGDHFEDVIAHLDRWGQACIDAVAFPPSQAKRAAG